jgi:O-antigen/teichoic acid export membrane protein
VLIALGSLNNSLYVRQINARERPQELAALTRSASRKIGVLSLAVVPVSLAVVWMFEAVSASIATRQLMLPTLLLALATVPYAFAVPYGFALNAQNRERMWLVIILVATLVDVVAVVAVGSRGATAVAAIWLVTQIGVWVAVTRFAAPLSGRRRATVTATR